MIKNIFNNIRFILAAAVLYMHAVLKNKTFFHSKVIKDLKEFKKISDVLVVNRHDSILDDVEEEIYTRGLFGNN